MGFQWFVGLFVLWGGGEASKPIYQMWFEGGYKIVREEKENVLGVVSLWGGREQLVHSVGEGNE